MKPPEYWRIRAACSDITGLTPDELEQHAQAITSVVLAAKAAPIKRRPLEDAA